MCISVYVPSIFILHSKEKSISRKFQKHIDDNLSQIRSLEDKLQEEKDEQKKQLDLLENEVSKMCDFWMSMYCNRQFLIWWDQILSSILRIHET